MPDIYLYIQGQKVGPYEVEQVRHMRAENRVSPITLAWYEGLTEWKTVGKVLAAFPAHVSVEPASTPHVTTDFDDESAITSRRRLTWLISCGITLILLSLGVALLIPRLGGKASTTTGSAPGAQELAQGMDFVAQTGTIAKMMEAYAKDHDGNYPSGKTSTEVFQKLLDENYATDPAVFFVVMPGKSMPNSRTLLAENVCFDVTAGITLKSSGRVPVVFTTGYTVDYRPDGEAKPIDEANVPLNGVAVTYKNGIGGFRPWPPRQVAAGYKAPGFIDKDFNAAGAGFTQLKP